jgi:hypothetical protein
MITQPYHAAEIEGLAKAIAGCGRDIVLSLSPGPAPLERVAHLRQCANMWRISNDLWDLWEEPDTGYAGLNGAFDLCAPWAPHIVPGSWPDADMLPLGRIGKSDARGEERLTRLTQPEQVALMTLWCVFRSPLMFGGDLARLDQFTESLLTNPEVLEVNQRSCHNRQVSCDETRAVWVAEHPDSGDTYLALFNRSDESAILEADLAGLGITGPATVRDLWALEDLGTYRDGFRSKLPAHGAGLYRISR